MATARKTPEKAGPKTSQGKHVPVFQASAERLAAGRLLRTSVPRASHADWKPPTNRRDPMDILEASNQGRLPDLVPIRIAEADWGERVQEGLSAYRQSLSDERRVLLDRYRLEDSALKVVGIGSVGTRCYITLLVSEGNHPLILQFKEADRSVLEPYTDRSPYDNQGERVVMGQRLMQSSSDLFLGWARGRHGYDLYVRQLRDMKMSYPIEGMTAVQLMRYAEMCGRTLGRAHAKSGDAATISGYLGKGDKIDRAMRTFALAYADQAERDHAALVKAVRSGRVKALDEE